MNSIPQLPLGTKAAIKHAFAIAIRALEDRTIYPHPDFRADMAKHLRRMRRSLIAEKIIHP